MIQFGLFIIVYTITVFIFSFVYINKRDEKINRSFLLFLGNIMIWMIINVSSIYLDNDMMGRFIKTIYFISMMNIALFFLYFVYQLLQRKVDGLFYFSVFLNTATIGARLLMPIDYSKDNFWQLTGAPIAPIVAVIFSMPMLVSIFLVFKACRSTQHQRLRIQLRYLLIGIALATVISVISETLIPNMGQFSGGFSLMYQAFFVLNLFLYFAIIRHKFLNVQTEYIYQLNFPSLIDRIKPL